MVEEWLLATARCDGIPIQLKEDANQEENSRSSNDGQNKPNHKIRVREWIRISDEIAAKSKTSVSPAILNALQRCIANRVQVSSEHHTSS